jgi:fermentation-respiration switch protein FrsA (DUF1100 family)
MPAASAALQLGVRRWTVPWVRLRRVLIRTARLTAILYGALLVVLFLAQGWMVLPGRFSRGTPQARFAPPPGTELVHLTTSQGEPVTALFGPALNADGSPRPDDARRPSLLLFYGTGSWLRNFVPRFEGFRRLGVNVLVPEYVGYGLSGGEASEGGCYRTADAAYAYLLSRPDVDLRRVVIGGVSLGGAVAIDLAARKPASGLVTVSTFTTMTAMAGRQVPIAPVSLILHQRFESSRKIRRVHCPILMLHGTADPFIPHAMMGSLAAAATAPVTQVDVPRADHENALSIDGPEPAAHLREFLERVEPGGGR